MNYTDPPAHVAIIMDGNGRWGERRGQPRCAGHVEGARAVRRTVRGALGLNISVLTLYAFSTDNWKRPPEETTRLMDLFHDYLRREAATCVRHGIRLKVFGRRDRLSPGLRLAVTQAESATAAGRNLCLRLAIDYSARDAITRAAYALPNSEPAEYPLLMRAIRESTHDLEVPPVDLLIRTGGEHRLSDLFGLECGHAEILFMDTMWPDFGESELRRAVNDFKKRERRFGSLPSATRSRSTARTYREKLQPNLAGLLTH